MKQYLLIIEFLLVFTPQLLKAGINADSLLENGTLENVIQYALKHQPLIQKSVLDEQITNSQVNSRLADWYPQIGYNYNLQHNFQLQASVFQSNIVRLGNANTSTNQFTYTQNILDPGLIF